MLKLSSDLIFHDHGLNAAGNACSAPETPARPGCVCGPHTSRPSAMLKLSSDLVFHDQDPHTAAAEAAEDGSAPEPAARRLGHVTVPRMASCGEPAARRVGARVFYFVQEGADSLDLNVASGSKTDNTSWSGTDDAASDSSQPSPAVRKTPPPRATRLLPPAPRPPELQPNSDLGASPVRMQMKREACAGLDTKGSLQASFRVDGPYCDGCRSGHDGNTAAAEETIGATVDTGSLPRCHPTHLLLADAMGSSGRWANRLVEDTNFEPLTYNQAVSRLQRCDYTRGYRVAEVPLIGRKTAFWHELVVGADTGIAWLHSESPRSHFHKVCDLKLVTCVKHSQNYAHLGIEIKGSKIPVELVFADPADKAMFLEVLSPFIGVSRSTDSSQVNSHTRTLRGGGRATGRGFFKESAERRNSE